MLYARRYTLREDIFLNSPYKQISQDLGLDPSTAMFSSGLVCNTYCMIAKQTDT